MYSVYILKRNRSKVSAFNESTNLCQEFKVCENYSDEKIEEQHSAEEEEGEKIGNSEGRTTRGTIRIILKHT